MVILYFGVKNHTKQNLFIVRSWCRLSKCHPKIQEFVILQVRILSSSHDCTWNENLLTFAGTDGPCMPILCSNCEASSQDYIISKLKLLLTKQYFYSQQFIDKNVDMKVDIFAPCTQIKDCLLFASERMALCSLFVQM